MKVLIEINSKDSEFAIKALKSFSFVKKIIIPTNPISKLEKDLKVAAKEVRLHKKGKIKLKTAEELLKEL